MKNRLKFILSLACLSVACISAAACKPRTQLEEYRNQGYVVSVTYDANGGSFLNRDGVTLMDLFNPTDYKDANGEMHISLIEPTGEERKTSNLEKITLTMQGHFFAGWYEGREVLRNEKGAVVDTYGVELVENSDGTFSYAATKEKANPAYTYSGYWDFENDTIDYQESDGIVEKTLYAAWVPFYQFDYYYKPTANSNWELLTSTTFDYKLVNEAGSKQFDRDTIWTPDWVNGAMNHQYYYDDKSELYTFPQIEGKTFVAAYTDSACTNKIEGSLIHHGTLDMQTGIASNRVQEVYIVAEEGTHYRIETAEQLYAHATSDGIYEIVADLDFYDTETQTQIAWPAAFECNEFTGKFYGSEGKTYALKNVVAEHSSSSSELGGLFGGVAKDAEIKNVTFENVTLDISSTKARMQEGRFGLFAGNIADGAKISGVTVSGTVRVGEIDWVSETCLLNLLANGQTTGITKGEIKLQIYGNLNWATGNTYYYTINPDTVTVDGNGNVSMVYEYGQEFGFEFKDINIE